MDLLFACFGQGNKRKRWLEDVVERGKDIIDRETVAFNRDLQKILISKATHKKDIAAHYNLFPFPATGQKQSFKINTCVTAEINDNKDPIVMSGWVHFACDHAAETTSNNAEAEAPPKVVTCNAQGHTITGQGEDQDGQSFKITRGSWSPAGNYYWIEERMNAQTKQETLTFVLGNLFENNDQSATVFEGNGKKTRVYRTLELVADGTETRCCCPSSQTAARLTSEAAKK